MLSDAKLFLLDMDGTLYLGDEVIDGAHEFIRALEETGREYIYLTNNSSRAGMDYIERLRKLGYAPGVVDGKYGSNCIRAVRKFQTNAGLEADGRVDEATWEALFADDAPKNKKK